MEEGWGEMVRIDDQDDIVQWINPNPDGSTRGNGHRRGGARGGRGGRGGFIQAQDQDPWEMREEMREQPKPYYDGHLTLYKIEGEGGCALEKLRNGTVTPSKWVASLYNNSAHADVTIKCQTEVFHCHKLILFQSQVFERMLTSPMLESRSNEITISDVDPTALGLLLKCMYGKPCDGPLGYMDLLGLIHCADKYDLEAIKQIGLEAMPALVTLENVGQMTVAAFQYSAPGNLLDFFRSFCQREHSALIKDPAYRELFRSNLDAFI